MRLGVSTSVYWDYKHHDIAYALEHMIEIGLSCVEILCEHPFYYNWATADAKSEKIKLKDLLASHPLDISLHAPYHDLNLASLNPGMRRETLTQLKEAISTGRELGASVVVIHPGFISSRKYKVSAAWRVMCKNLELLVEYAKDHDIMIALENIANKPKALCTGIEEMLRVMQTIGSENLRVALDVAHANTFPNLSPLSFVKRLSRFIEHLHVSDNQGKDNHLPIGVGNIDYTSILKELKKVNYQGMLILEGWIPSEPDKFVQISKERLEKILQTL